MKTTAVLIYGILCFVLGGVLVYFWMPQVKTEITVSDTNIDSVSIIQDARLGYVPLEELQAVIRQKAKKRRQYNIIDSVIVRDSLNIIDSTVISYVPYLYADSSFVFEKTNLEKGYEFSSVIDFHTRFYPLSEHFQLDAKMTKFDIKITYEQLWKFEPYSGAFGYVTGLATAAGIVYLSK